MMMKWRSWISRIPWYTRFYFISFIAYTTYLWSNIISIDPRGNLTTGGITVWGDWALHFTLGSSVAYKSLILSSNPLLISEPLLYPYVSDWLAGLLIRIGMPFFSAFLLLSYVFTIFTIGAVFYFFYTFTKKYSYSTLASVLFFFSGGLGFLPKINSLNTLKQWEAYLNNPQIFFTHIPEQSIQWISITQSMLIPQRSFILGFPLALISLAYIYNQIKKSPAKRKLSPALIGSSILFGLLPIIHPHSFIAVGIILAGWTIIDIYFHQKKAKIVLLYWSQIAAISLLISSPFLLQIISNRTQSFMNLQIGWMANPGLFEFIKFWILNWSTLPILTTLGIIFALLKKYPKKIQKTFVFLIPFLVIWFLGNLVTFQPWEWDNTKIFVWSLPGFVIFAIYGLQYLASILRNPKSTCKSCGTLLIAILIFSSTISSLFDALTIIRFSSHSYIMYSQEDLVLTEWVKKNTHPKSIWLTATKHNNWLYNLTGRQALMVFNGWLWSQGYNYQQIMEDQKEMFADPTSPKFTKYNVQYVVIGQAEMREFAADKTLFEQFHKPVYEFGETTIYAVSSLDFEDADTDTNSLK